MVVTRLWIKGPARPAPGIARLVYCAPKLKQSRARALLADPVGIDPQRARAALSHLRPDHHRLHPLEAGELEHRVEQDRLHDRAEPASAGLAVDGLARDGLEGVLRDCKANVLHLEQALVLLDEG